MWSQKKQKMNISLLWCRERNPSNITKSSCLLHIISSLKFQNHTVQLFLVFFSFVRVEETCMFLLVVSYMFVCRLRWFHWSSKKGLLWKYSIFHGGHLFFRLEEWWNYQKYKRRETSGLKKKEEVFGASYWERCDRIKDKQNNHCPMFLKMSNVIWFYTSKNGSDLWICVLLQCLREAAGFFCKLLSVCVWLCVCVW